MTEAQFITVVLFIWLFWFTYKIADISYQQKTRINHLERDIKDFRNAYTLDHKLLREKMDRQYALARDRRSSF